MSFTLRNVFLFFIVAWTQVGFSQTIERSTYAVFTSITPNDSLLVAGGQIMTGEADSPNIEHGYYPLNHSLLSVEEDVVTSDYVVYPNPFTERFFINCDNIQEEMITVEVYSISGELVLQFETTQSIIEINMPDQSSGLYYIKGYSSQGEIFNEKMIKS